MPDSAIGADGRTVRCAKCRHSWHQEGPDLAAPFAETMAEVPAPMPEPVPAPDSSTPAYEDVTAEPVAPQPVPAAPVQQAAPPPREAIRVPGRHAAPEAPPSAAPAEPAPAAAPAERSTRKPASVYDDTTAVHYADEGHSSFDFAPPFRPRRNWTRIATFGSALFAVVALGLTGAVAWGGLPDWLPIPHQTFSQAQPDLQLDFPRKRQDRKPLPDGTEFFSVSGTISNIGSQSRKVPSLLVVLRDKRDRIVYEKEVAPSKRQLAPGEAITVNEALTDIPKAASAAEIGWKPE